MTLFQDGTKLPAWPKISPIDGSDWCIDVETEPWLVEITCIAKIGRWGLEKGVDIFRYLIIHCRR